MYVATDFLTLHCNKFFGNKIDEITSNPKKLRRMVLSIVCIALLLDNMLYMVIVPIIPFYVQNMYHQNNIAEKEKAQQNYTISLYNMSSTNHTFNINKTNTKYHPLIPYKQHQDSSIGLLFASKAFIQLAMNPVSGTVIDRVGYDYPLLFGLIIIFFSTSLFAFGSSYGILFIARSLQGLGSAFADTAGLAMIADRFPEENERKKALGLAIAFISFGSLFAPPFGGILYEFAGKALPFILLAMLALFDGILLIIVMRPVRDERKIMQISDDLPKATPIYHLILDPYIAICAGALVMANISLAFLEPTIAIWMRKTMNASEWAIGLVWLPAFFPHIFGVFLTVKFASRYPTKQWIIVAIGLLLDGLGCILVPMCTNFVGVIIPLMILCFGIALVDTALLPTLGYLVDSRYVSVYGSVYAIADISYSIAYALGPIVASNIVNLFGFTFLCVSVFFACILYIPLLRILRTVYKYENFVETEDTDKEIVCEEVFNVQDSLVDKSELYDTLNPLNDDSPTTLNKRSLYKYNRFNSINRDSRSRINSSRNSINNPNIETTYNAISNDNEH